MKRRLGLVLTAAALAVLLPATSVVADPRDDKSAVDDRVKELQQEFEGLDEDLARVIAERDAAKEKLPDAEAESKAADDALAKAIEKDEDMAARLTSATNAQKDLKETIKSGTEEIDKHKTSAARIGRQAYQNSGITSDLAMLLQMAEGTSADGGIGRVDSAVRSQQRTIDKLSEQRALNKNNEERLSGVTDKISDLKDEAAEAVVAKEAAQVDAKKKADSLNDLISAKDDAEKTISDNKDKTEKQLADEKAEQERLAEKVREWEKEQEKKGKFVFGDGVLANPAKGYPTTSPFGYRIHPITGEEAAHRNVLRRALRNPDPFGRRRNRRHLRLDRRLRQPRRHLPRQDQGQFDRVDLQPQHEAQGPRRAEGQEGRHHLVLRHDGRFDRLPSALRDHGERRLRRPQTLHLLIAT